MRTAAIAAIGVVISAHSTAALEPAANEQELLQACEVRICKVTVGKKAAGEPLKCALNKTWTRRVIEASVSTQKMNWRFGDARCAVDLELSRGEIVDALTKPVHTIIMPAHQIKCDVERESELLAISLKAAPKLQFKNGQLVKLWLNVSAIEAPTVIKGAIWTAAKLEDNVGVFHGRIVKGVNKFLHERCPERHGG